MTTRPYDYLVESRAGRPVSLWRRTGPDRWQYLSLIGWNWRDATPVLAGPPPPQRLTAIDTAQAVALLGDRHRWVRYWAVYRRRELGGPDQPITVIRRRNSPEAAHDEVFHAARPGWVWTDLLVRSETGRGSSLPALHRVPHAEAESILRHIHGITGATDRWAPTDPDPAAPGWHGTGRDTGRHLPAADQARAATEHRRARTAQPVIDTAIGSVADQVDPRRYATLAPVDTVKPWPSYRRNAAAARDCGEPIADAISQADLHRYSLTFPAPQYPDGVRDAFDALARAGLAPVPGTHHDLWDHYLYQGVNTVWRHTGTGRLVEILFHTRASFLAMQAGDAPYEILRCRYLPDGRTALTPTHRTAARCLLAEPYRPAPLTGGPYQSWPPTTPAYPR